MKKQLESQIEASIVAYAKKQGVLSYKFVSPSQRAIPDRLFVYQGKVLFLEVKRQGETPTLLQLHEMAKLKGQGMFVTWVDSVTDGKMYIDKLISWNQGGLGRAPLLGCSCCEGSMPQKVEGYTDL